MARREFALPSHPAWHSRLRQSQTFRHPYGQWWVICRCNYGYPVAFVPWSTRAERQA